MRGGGTSEVDMRLSDVPLMLLGDKEEVKPS